MKHMKNTKKIILIACLLLITSISYARAIKKEDSPLVKGPIGGSTYKSCVHQTSWLNEQEVRVYGPAYAYYTVFGMEPCPEFSNQFEHPQNIITGSELANIQWGALSVPVSEPNTHGHCDVRRQLSLICVNGNTCNLSPTCTNYDHPTLSPFIPTIPSLIPIGKHIHGSAKRVDPENHCQLGHGNPL